MLYFNITPFSSELSAHMIMTLSTTLICLSKVQSDTRDENNIFKKRIVRLSTDGKYGLKLTFWHGFGIYLDSLQEVVLQGLHHLFLQLL